MARNLVPCEYCGEVEERHKPDCQSPTWKYIQSIPKVEPMGGLSLNATAKDLEKFFDLLELPNNRLSKYWFTMGEIAFMEGFTVEEACPYSSETTAFINFCAGWKYSKDMHDAK